jgi:DnaJ family protein A protein 2
MDPADLFAQFFGAAGGPNMFGFDFGPAASGPRRGKDSVISHDVTLEDLYTGKSVKMNMSKEAVCAPCKGYVLFCFLYCDPANRLTSQIWSTRTRKA